MKKRSLSKYQSGGSWEEGMMKSKMATADAMGNPAAHRMVQNYPPTYTFTGKEPMPSWVERPEQGSSGTHFLSSMGEYAVPFIQAGKSGKLNYKPNASFRDKEAMKFNNKAEAEYFANHYKDVAPMMRNQEQYANGGISTTGYRNNSPHENRDFNIIPSGRISMNNVNYPVYGQDNLGNKQIMMPEGEYNFPGHTVYEIPLKGNNMKLKRGGAATGHAGQFWDGEKWVSSGDGATDDNGVFYQNGGPTYMPGGAGPLFMMGGAAQVYPFAMNPGPGTGTGMLQEYANETMQMGGNAQVHPFAMNPGPGFGGGMLEEYADETMKKGGHAKKQKKLSPQQMQMMMQAMAGAGQGQQQGPPGMPPMGMPPQQGMMPPQQQGAMPPMGMAPQGQAPMASGGIHIKKSHEGRFTAYKERTGKTTEEALHSKDPHVRQMANFAHNAAKWHHQFGGATMQDGGIAQGGNTIRDAQGNIFAYGGQVNPYHPLAKFMQSGGNVSPDDPMGGGMNLPANNDGTQDAWKATPGNYDPGTDPNNPVNNPPPMPEQGGYEAAQGPAFDSTGVTDQQQDQQQPQQKRSGWDKFNNTASVVLTGIGAAAGIGAAYADRADQRRMAGYQRSLGMSDHIAAVNQPGGHGDYTQYGSFRPDATVPTRPGNFYQKQQYGGNFAFGGLHHGQEIELDDVEIARLKKMGYQFEDL